MAFLDETGLNYLWSKLKQKFLSLTGGTLSGDLTASRTSATNTFLGVSNSVRSGDLRVGSTGNFGLYDKTRGTWLIRSDPDGATYLGERLMNDVVVAQGVTNGWIWRKYASGIAECGRNFNNSEMQTFGTYRYVNTAFPFPFNGIPVGLMSDISPKRVDELPPIQVSIRAITLNGFQAVLSTSDPSADGSIGVHFFGTYSLGG